MSVDQSLEVMATAVPDEARQLVVVVVIEDPEFTGRRQSGSKLREKSRHRGIVVVRLSLEGFAYCRRIHQQQGLVVCVRKGFEPLSQLFASFLLE